MQRKYRQENQNTPDTSSFKDNLNGRKTLDSNFMKKLYTITILLACILISFTGRSQHYPHYTMFMFNKLIYNPAYAGSKDLTTVNIFGRKQWTGFPGAPTSMNVSVHGPIGSYMKPFRAMAMGGSINTEKVGVTKNTNLMSYYSYRIRTGRNSVLSLGLQAGVALYSADYSSLNPYQMDDPELMNNVNNRPLPNFGAGAYYSGANYYMGFAIPNLLQNSYNSNTANTENLASKQVRTYFLSGGYVFTLSHAVKMEPQVLARYAGNSNYGLPFNADMNVSFFFYERLMLGATYRTDKSLEGVAYVQLTSNIYVGYSYDYTLSQLRGFNKGTHELTLGYDFLRDRNKYINPRFIKLF